MKLSRCKWIYPSKGIYIYAHITFNATTTVLFFLQYFWPLVMEISHIFGSPS